MQDEIFKHHLPKPNDQGFEPQVNWGEKGDRWWEFRGRDFLQPEEYQWIRPLTGKYSEFLWGYWVDKQLRQLTELPLSSWPAEAMEKSRLDKSALVCSPEELKPFVPFAQRAGKPDRVAEACLRSTSRAMDDIVVVLWYRKIAIATRWDIYLRYWQNFGLIRELRR